MTAKDGSPFRCEDCGEKDRADRNCLNRLGLSDDTRAVREYTDDVKMELKEKNARKVFSLGNLRLYECPLSYVTEDIAEIMRLVYLMDASGHLLHQGGWADQPCWLIEAYEIYRVEHAENIRRLNNL
ncbi:MAG: hypothetical protein HZB83_05430 [Deltaproteobacteria bacterium]|nr:hypothetical protein [Deltaproteobacteria bacterium]